MRALGYAPGETAAAVQAAGASVIRSMHDVLPLLA
jgi:hypothetical protein